MVQILLLPSLDLDVLDVIIVNVGHCFFANCVVVTFIDVLITYDPVDKHQLGQMDKVFSTRISNESAFCCRKINI